MRDRSQKGKDGEALAAAFLEQKGYEVVARNYRFKRSEIDLVVRQNGWLVFVEVKMRSSTAFGFPEAFVTDQKAAKVLEGAAQYMEETNWRGPVRYDVVAITQRGEETDIRHFEDAFY